MRSWSNKNGISDQILYLSISKLQGADQDYFAAKNEDDPDPTGRVDSAWIWGDQSK